MNSFKAFYAKIVTQLARVCIPWSLLLQFKDVHRLGIAGCTQELAVVAEGQ